ncbi:MAG: curli production assembly/transport component CsgF [Marinifilaceae bacterium]
MKCKYLYCFAVFLLGIIFSGTLSAQDFVYKPINTAFGGDQLNASWLLNSASQQNRIEDPNQEDQFGQNDPLDDFRDNLNRQILNELSRRLVDKIFGETGDLETGSFELGDFQVDIFEDGSGLNVNIQDITNGNSTSVQIPFF